MSQFEQNLREALKRQEPPSGFAGKVIANTRSAGRRSLRLGWLAAAAAIALVLIGAPLYQQHRRQVEGERAKNELMAGLRLTGTKLRTAQALLFEVQKRTMELRFEQ